MSIKFKHSPSFSNSAIDRLINAYNQQTQIINSP